ncbi:MAG: SPOR domain-containing protein [Gammaproteobacteria bacterium]
MEVQFQQRIVGAIVLVTLGVIFIPALLDGSGYKTRQVKDIKIKDKPEFPPLKQKKLKPIATPLATIKTQQDKALKSDPKKPHKKAIRSFALQVGTFASNKNAEKLRDTLRKAGYTAFIQKSQSRGKASYKVRVGPELEHSVVDKWKKDLRKSHKIDAYVVNHP